MPGDSRAGSALLPPSPDRPGTPFREDQGESGILTHVLCSNTPRFPWTALSTMLTCELTGITEASVSAGTNSFSIPAPHQPTSGQTEAPPAHATGFTTPPARTEGALDR
jgi:hypothetical protein